MILRGVPLFRRQTASEWRRQCAPWKGIRRPLFPTKREKTPLITVRFNTPMGARILRKIRRYGAGGGVRFRCFTSAVETFVGQRQSQRGRSLALADSQAALPPANIIECDGHYLADTQSVCSNQQEHRVVA